MLGTVSCIPYPRCSRVHVFINRPQESQLFKPRSHNRTSYWPWQQEREGYKSWHYATLPSDPANYQSKLLTHLTLSLLDTTPSPISTPTLEVPRPGPRLVPTPKPKPKPKPMPGPGPVPGFSLNYISSAGSGKGSYALNEEQFD